MVSAEPRVENILATIREAIDKGPEPAPKLPPAPGAAAAAPRVVRTVPVQPKTTGNSSISLQDKGTLMRGAMREFRVSFDTSASPSGNTQGDIQIAELRERIRRTTEEALAVPQRQSSYTPIPPPPPRMAEMREREDGFAGLLSGRADIREPAPPPPSNATRTPSYAHQAPRYQPEELRPTYAEQDYSNAYGEEAAYADPYAQPMQQQPVQPQHVQHLWEEDVQPAYADPYYEEQHYEEPAAPPPRQQQRTAPRALISSRAERATRGSFEELAEVIMARAGGDRGLEDMTRDLLRGLLRNWLDENLPELVEKLVREEIERVARGR
jgi:uncharacterized protein